jgi:hypothetical protein
MYSKTPPTYCKKCGMKLEFFQKEASCYFDRDTGQKNITYRFRWFCPHQESHWWHSGHTNIEIYGSEALSAYAYTAKEAEEWADYCMS